MKETKVNIDATFGTEVKVGDVVQAGQKLGIKPDCFEPEVCRKKGAVEEIIFDPAEHSFQIVIRS